jgi:hypothetical protein
MKLFFFTFLILVLFPFKSSVAQTCFPIGGPSYVVNSNEDYGFSGEFRSIINQANAGGVPCNIYFNIIGSSTIMLNMASLPAFTVQVSVQGTNLYNNQPITINGGGYISMPALRFNVAGSCQTSNMIFTNFAPLYYVVLNTNNSGPGSLRQGIMDVNSAGEGSISFNIPGIAPHRIPCLTEFPAITGRILIDGTTQPAYGYAGTDPKIEIDGSGLSATSSGLNVKGINGCQFYGLYIHHFGYGIKIDRLNSTSFPFKYGGGNFKIGAINKKNVISNNNYNGIYIEGVKGGLIEYNYIGTNPAGDAAAGNYNGITLFQDTTTIIRQNLISGNTYNGIQYRSVNLKITGNKIGTNLAGTSAIGNLRNGIDGGGSGTYVTIGGTTSAEGNLISGNSPTNTYSGGIFLLGGSGTAKIIGNKIGTDITGNIAIPNYIGILNNGTMGSIYIGGSTIAERNIISGNLNAGMFIKDATDTIYIKGNYVGLNVSGNSALGNGEEGVVVYGGAKVVQIGGPNNEKNVISGNRYFGIEARLGGIGQSIKYEILNNIIGLNALGTTAIPNMHGINLYRTINNVLVSENILSGNLGIGIIAAGDNHQIKNNKIGTNATGTLIAGNNSGILIGADALNVIVGGTGATDPNLIVNNTNYGITMNHMNVGHTRYNRLTRNIIYNNGNKGISHGVNPDGPANDGYPKPVITWATPTKVEGTAPANALIEIYESHTLNAFTQGKTYIASVNADASGNWEYTASFASPYNLTALAIDANNNTSEYSDKYNYTQWTGIISNDWHNAGNWTNGIPDCSKHTVIVDVANDPVISTANAIAYDVLVLNPGSLSIAPAVELVICKGNWGYYGSTALLGGSVEFQGTALQKIYGTSRFTNVTINNSGSGISMHNNVEVTGVLTLTDGLINTGGFTLNHSSSTATDIIGFSSNSFIYGNLRRNIASNSDTYVFPLGNGSDATNYYRIDLLNNNLSGVTYITGSINTLTESGNNIDSRLTVTEESISYTNIHETAVWNLVPDVNPIAGSYGVRLYIENIPSLTNNEFVVLKRPTLSSDYADWTYVAGTLIPSDDSPGRTITGGYAERTGYTSFSQFAIADGGSPLPVTLLSFSGVLKSEGVHLTWATSSEINHQNFIIQRSNDLIHFKNIAFVNSTGDSKEEQNYSFIDKDILSGITYYRLQQIDKDGSFTFSKIISVNTEFIGNVFPNPFKDHLTIMAPDNDQDLQIRVNDLSNKEYFNRKFKSGIIELDLIHLNTGIYFITIQTEDRSTTLKLIKE